MRQQLFFQDATSNKFWTAEADGTNQIITFGAVSAKGRRSEKQFASAEACVADTEKLIQQKIKKGYTKLAENEGIPEKPASSPDEVGQRFFWHSIEKSNKRRNTSWSEYNVEEHIENLTELLSKSGKQKLIQFEKQLDLFESALHR
ncbi:MAG: WGR domain-containing protein [Janthinobacterium lividum]